MNEIKSDGIVGKAPRTYSLEEMDTAIRPLRNLLEKQGHLGLAEELHRLIKNVDEDPYIPGIPPQSIRGIMRLMETLDLNRRYIDDYSHFGVWENGDLNFEMRLNAHTNRDTHFVITGLDGNWLSFAAIISTPASVIVKESGEDTRLHINGRGLVTDIVKLLESVFKNNGLSSILGVDKEDEVSAPLPKTISLELEEKQ